MMNRMNSPTKTPITIPAIAPALSPPPDVCGCAVTLGNEAPLLPTGVSNASVVVKVSVEPVDVTVVTKIEVGAT